MKIHEYQAKELFAKYDVPVPKGVALSSHWESYDAALEVGGDTFVIKAQIHAGGRGKAGGVKLAHSPDEVAEIAEQMLGQTLVTKQTGPEGKQVKKILVSAAVNIDKEYYLAILVDRKVKRLAIMASTAGGMDIEQVADEHPEKIQLEHAQYNCQLFPYTARKIAYGLGFRGRLARECARIITNLHRLFMEKDCTLIEVNPLVLTHEGSLLCVDAKMDIDDNALPRHPELRRLRDFEEENNLEILARRYGVDYVKLDGQIGCMVNGAGLAMATMDVIKQYGGEPANFLDIKGSASKENVVKAFKLLTADRHVKALLINIFGGIVRGDMVALGILEAMKEVEVNMPVVVRIEGTNAEEGRRMLAESSYKFILADGLAEAARKVVAVLPGGDR
ncbi:MAG TPA: ADP-forming succinate--CoA ligase subunit beta [bacterium]|nr:ADP-forming succinate--CoA ligase subunit beta [bacterium]